MRALRPDLDLRPLRGNVPTRVERVTSGDLDAIVLARAGLVRLGLDRHITEIFAIDRVLPAPAQGALAIQCRAADAWILGALAALDDAATRRAVDAERALLHALGGGCSVPVGAVATPDAGELALAAGVFSADASQSIRTSLRGRDPIALGEAAARRLVALGAGGILDAFDKLARVDASALIGGPR
jgi:hydroxymethylbilane synthase